MKTWKVTAIVLGMVITAGSLAGCGAAGGNSATNAANSQENAEAVSNNASSQETAAAASNNSDNGKRVAKDGALMQTEDKTLPTRKLPENGTRINLHFGDTVIPGVLNDSMTAKALIEKLPVTVHMSRYSHDFCGPAKELNLPYQENEVHYGWLNGDIDYAIDAPWFTILFEDEDVSEQYGSQVNIGVIDCPISNISALQGSFDVVVELAK